MSRDLRQYARQTNIRLIVGALLLLDWVAKRVREE